MTNKPRVTFLSVFQSDRWKSIRRVSEELQTSLVKLSEQFEFVRYDPDENLKLLGSAVGRRILYPLAVRKLSQGIYHITDQSYSNLAYHLNAETTLITCHDLQFWRARSARNYLMRRYLLEGLKHVRWIACPSITVKNEILSIFPDLEPRVRMIPNAVDAHFRPAGNKSKLREKMGLSADSFVLLHVGNAVLPRKNIEFVFHIVRSLAERHKNLRFVQIGSTFHESQKNMINRLGIHDRITQIPNAAETELVEWYQAADVCVMPSTYEGFGLPIIEASACGTPVICSDIEVFREITANLAPCLSLNVPRWLTTLEPLLTDPKIKEQRSQQALQLASRYGQEKVARAYLELYEDIAKTQNWI